MRAIEKIMEEIDGKIEDYSGGSADNAFQGFVKGLKKAKKIIQKHMNDEWIPCSERMPDKEYDTVLCVTDINHYFVGVYNREFGFRTGDIDADGNVIAWHPLPEPYKLPVESADSKRMREREEFFEDGE